MKTIIVLSLAISAFPALAQGNKKDTAVVQTPDGHQIEVKVPRAAVQSVKQIGPNHYEVKVNKAELKKIEVRVLDKKK